MLLIYILTIVYILRDFRVYVSYLWEKKKVFWNRVALICGSSPVHLLFTMSLGCIISRVRFNLVLFCAVKGCTGLLPRSWAAPPGLGV